MKFAIEGGDTRGNLIEKLLTFSKAYSVFCILNSNGSGESFEVVAGFGAKRTTNILNDEIITSKEWKFGYISYDYKNSIEALVSENSDKISAAEILFFIPEIVFIVGKEEVEIIADNREEEERVFYSLQNIQQKQQGRAGGADLTPAMTKKEYLHTIQKVKNHIKAGDIYEMNYCMEFYNDDAVIDPVNVYLELNAISEAPFSFFFKNEHVYAIGSSPERFLKKNGTKLITQPIKGTARRSENLEEDAAIKAHLYYDEKERNENVMIVDVSRNDLSRVAEKGSVKVDELFGVYTFKQVHQMISTVSCDVPSDIGFKEIIDATFPPASMTGAPKISAMKIAEENELFKRGIYSGILGYIKPNDDFDFNVVIRTIIYNKIRRSLSVAVGSAITSKSDPEKEYDECLLKVKAMKEVLES